MKCLMIVNVVVLVEWVWDRHLIDRKPIRDVKRSFEL